jgi:hypothetical protein
MTPEELIRTLRNCSAESFAEYSKQLWKERADCVQSLLVRAEIAEMALRDLEALTEEVTHIEDFSLTTMIEIIRAYKEASCLKPSHG